MMGGRMKFERSLHGHTGGVTQVVANPMYPNVLISASRDKSIAVWNLDEGESVKRSKPVKSLHGHAHFVSDISVSSDGHYALSGSLDTTLRLWDLNTGVSVRQFVSHTDAVLSVAFSADNRQIVSGSRDKTIKLWNTLAQCKHTIEGREGHSDWVSTVRFSPRNPVILSAGWDKLVKVWDLTTCRLRSDYIGHGGYVRSATVAPDGSLCASGGKDGRAMLWNLNDGNHLYSLNGKNEIRALAFCPTRYWLCAAVGPVIKIWNFEQASVVDELKVDRASDARKTPPKCISLASSSDGQTLFAGYDDNTIRVWRVSLDSR